MEMEKLKLIPLLKRLRQLEQKAKSLVLADPNLTLCQLRLLTCLQQGNKTASELSRGLRITKASVTGQVKDLQAMELLSLSPDPADKRSAIIQLTKMGKTKLAIALTGVDILETHISAQLTVDAIAALNQFSLHTEDS